MMLSTILFWYFALVTVGAGVLAVTRANPVHALGFLVPCLLHVAGLFLILGAEFLAGAQVLIYTGAIVVLYIFVVALLNLSALAGGRIAGRRHLAAAVVTAVLAAQVTALIVLARPSAVSPGPGPRDAPLGAALGGNTQAVGSSLFTTYLFPFELASLVLLAAVFGAVLLSRREKGEPPPADAPKDRGAMAGMGAP
jgi:NADH-quinone oxidoreductase subunit J